MKLHSSRQVFPWVLLWKNCRQAFEDAQRDDQSEYLYLFSMLLCAFSLEAFLNYLLRLKYSGDWAQYERTANPKQKIKKICELLSYDLDLGKPPFQTFHEIFELRDNLAHAKTIDLEEVVSYPIEDFLHSNNLPPMPLSKWEKSLTPENAKRFFQDSKEIIQILYSAANLGSDPFEEPFSKTSWRGDI